MIRAEIALRRLHNQAISAPRFTTPADVVGWLGAVQAQDYAGAKWALGMRMESATDDDVERAFAEGSILRTHLLRPTWHFVTPLDIRWILELTAPRVHQANGLMYRRLEIDADTARRSNAAIATALRGGQSLTRDELRAVLDRAGVSTGEQFRMAYLMMRAELDGVVCSGPRRGKQFTYALLEERAPKATVLDRPAALTELARRHFLSRGPATVHDFAKWSGLTIADARRGLEAVNAGLNHEEIDGQTYWFSTSEPAPDVASPTAQVAAPTAHAVPPGAHLLSIYDEYVSGYRDRSAIVGAEDGARLVAMGNALTAIVVVDGQIVGTWKPERRREGLRITTNILRSLSAAEEAAVDAAARRYASFLQAPTVSVESAVQ